MKVEVRLRLKLLKRLIPGYALFFFSILLIGIVYGIIAKALVGMTFLFIAFVNIRYTYRDRITYHSMSTKKCIAMSIGLFAAGAFPLIVINMKLSLIMSVVPAIAMTWLLHVFGLKSAADARIAELTAPKPFDLDNCTEAELIERCRERFRRDVDYKTERAIKHFILKLPHEEIDVNPEQSKKERYRFRKILS